MSILSTLLQLAQDVATATATTTPTTPEVAFDNPRVTEGLIVFLLAVLTLLTAAAKYFADKISKRTKDTKAKAESTDEKVEEVSSTAASALALAEGQDRRFRTLLENAEKFALQAQRDFEANTKLRHELRDVIEDFNQVYQKMRNFEEQLKQAELKNKQLESNLAHVEEVLGKRVEELTNQNKEQGQRISDLEAGLSARDAYIDELEPFVPEQDRAEFRKRRPNGKHRKE